MSRLDRATKRLADAGGLLGVAVGMVTSELERFATAELRRREEAMARIVALGGTDAVAQAAVDGRCEAEVFDALAMGHDVDPDDVCRSAAVFLAVAGVALIAGDAPGYAPPDEPKTLEGT